MQYLSLQVHSFAKNVFVIHYQVVLRQLLWYGNKSIYVLLGQGISPLFLWVSFLVNEGVYDHFISLLLVMLFFILLLFDNGFLWIGPPFD
jgi:hypothetical protein